MTIKNEEREAFEAWAMSHGGLVMQRVGDDLRCRDGRYPATYREPETETAWRAWANKPAGRTYPVELTPALREVLSLMVWKSGQIAHVLRAGGADIPKKAEAEQAHVLHWLIQLALEHGVHWWEHAYASLKEIQDALGNGNEGESNASR
ncbi:hypothetical protein LMG31506_03025 [Cupriavidus yeoncheonensis]|uniref:Uncharacterized protein n=1 Tax=Cupriavidus yeoncheonensis TaxID=1462994 RepID=A0A916IVL7_9BURK|nr:hypothetical protein [Cupriavidus yeoncheonensis]CAG2144527.1 hypothetical protein LMG31506_03025 [Cupriavidus yeoncheonensis]